MVVHEFQILEGTSSSSSFTSQFSKCRCKSSMSRLQIGVKLTVTHQTYPGTHSSPTWVMTELAFVAFLARPSLTECAKVFRIHTEQNFLCQREFPVSNLLPTKFDASPPRPSVSLQGPLPAPSRGSCEIRRSFLAVLNVVYLPLDYS